MHHPRTAAPATFFLSRSPHASDTERSPSPDASEDAKESMYGVHSLADTLSRSELTARSPRGFFADSQHTRSLSQESDDMEDAQCSRRRSTIKPPQSDDTRDSSLRPPPLDAASRPLTPLHPEEPSSLPSSPKSISNQSLRPLDDISITDETNSQTIGSGDEDERLRASPRLGLAGASQFIMPSIRMPSRRPFTERGKAMGRFKVLVAGAPGSGKTSCIKSLVQTCEDIVHVDSLDSPSVTALERRRSSRPHSRYNPTLGMPTAITEIYASTKPYPSWWSDLEDSRVFRRRKSIGEIVLERNLCFVDTPATSLSRAGQTDSVVQYMRQQLHRATAAVAGSGVDFQNLLAGNGGSQVDAVLYLISLGKWILVHYRVQPLTTTDTLSMDVECIRKLCELSNVIPVVAKADTLSTEQIVTIKEQFHQKARDAGIKPFMFGDSLTGDLDDRDPQPPYAVSSKKTTDLEVMDASTLMSPDYEQPLVPSELDTLVLKLFDRDNLAWLRHSAAKKLAQRRGDFPAVPPSPGPLPNALSGATPAGVGWRAASGMSMNSSISSLGESPSTYAMARLTDYTRHEEHMAQVRLAQWATDLQRSLQNERERYAAMARGDRAVWLTERLSECVIDGSLVPISQTPGFCGLHIPSTEKSGSGPNAVRACSDNGKKYRVAGLSAHDPLGVVGWIDDIGRRGWVIVQIVGSVGVVGGLALWLARSWGLPTRSLPDLHLDYLYGGVER
ncbi:uncharacterized protein N7482_002359 [Penicillium canariense]|uniref:Septin-type G domain-containing protein n=1 Tax=Penicillium canariense TaxID=189055 RepID=A0A9W9IHF7_9EURO|nr:uncharacterized protein N7482_002359 [Penicillium canariense]KAJ5176482.1 hypothetical protein N7482_002359 [Penicillium canariense]